MPNPFGIEQVDVGGIIGAYQSGQNRRRELIQARRADDKQMRLEALYSKLQAPKGGDPASSGMAGPYVRPATVATSEAQPQAVSQPAMPVQQPPMTQPHQSFMEQHGATISEIMGIDPQQGAALVANFSKLDDAQREVVKRQTDFMGQAVLDVSRLPEQSRAQVWADYVRQAESSGMDIPTHYEVYSPQALRSAAAEAGVMKELLSQFEPKYTNVVPGTDAVNINPRSAIDPFSGTNDVAPVSQSGERPSPEEFARFKESLRPDLRAAAQAAYDGGDMGSVPSGSPLSPTNNLVSNAPRGSRQNRAQILQDARDAIAQGADPAKVRARLRQMGINQ